MSEGNQIRILTVDDQPLLREGIAAILASEADMILVAQAGNGRESDREARGPHPCTVQKTSYTPTETVNLKVTIENRGTSTF